MQLTGLEGFGGSEAGYPALPKPPRFSTLPSGSPSPCHVAAATCEVTSTNGTQIYAEASGMLPEETP